MGFKVLKFGGASIKDSSSVINTSKILANYKGEKAICVFSAMGKTTNALEKLVCAKMQNNVEEAQKVFEEVKTFHTHIINKLFDAKDKAILNAFNRIFNDLEAQAYDEASNDYNYEYDQLVYYGEFLATKIISHYLTKEGFKNKWIDVRDYLKTDNTYREAKVDWKLTSYLSNKFLYPVLLKENMVIVQGFIGGTTENHTTSLGREGSDFTASVFAYCLDADEVQIWKDVPGLLNADPRFFNNPVKINKMSFQEAIELAYYGAKIIHPKTIKPLQNKNIPLKVKSFLNPGENGTLICNEIKMDDLVPSFILKQDQVLISISTRDFSFIAEDHLEMIFGFFAKYLVKINLMQNSAISFSVCCDDEQEKITSLISDLKKYFYLRYNKGLELITIRHYDDESIEKVLKMRKIYLEQTSRSTIQMLVEKNE